MDSSSIAPSTPGFLEFQFNQANAATSGAALAWCLDFTSAGFTFDDSQDASLGGDGIAFGSTSWFSITRLGGRTFTTKA